MEALKAEHSSKIIALEGSNVQVTEFNLKLTQEKQSLLEAIGEYRNKECLLIEEKKSLSHYKSQQSEEIRDLKAKFDIKAQEFSAEQKETRKHFDLYIEIQGKLKIQIEEYRKLEHEKSNLTREIKNLKTTLDQKTEEIFKLQQFTYLIEEVNELKYQLQQTKHEYQAISQENLRFIEVNRKLGLQLALLVTSVKDYVGPCIEEGDFVHFR